jgi:hypothetical protein
MGMSVEDRRDGCVETLNDLICWSQWFEMGWLGFGRYQSIEIDRGTHRWYQEAYVPLPRLVLLPFQQLQVQSQARPIVLKDLSPWFARKARSFAILHVTSWPPSKRRMTCLIPEIGVHTDNSKSYSRISIRWKTGIMAARDYYLLMSKQSRSQSSNQLAMLQ